MRRIPYARPFGGLLSFSACIALSSSASAQFGNEWLTYAESPATLVADNNVGAGDTQEKDYAWADLDQDGDIDLISVRKQGFTTSGRRTNVLLLNEGGVLTDSTLALATSSSVAGDQGFLTPTNDRDVQIADLNGDGWLDVVTAVTFSPGQPKEISHPRIYLNLGEDGNGDWLGLRYEDALFPLLVGAQFPRFCSVSVGDVDNDGDLDLYFSDATGGGGGGDMNDRLLINDGSASFTDETAARMTTQMTNSGFGHSSEMRDLNGDGNADIVKTNSFVSPSRVQVAYNDPAAVGTFNLSANASTQSPYFVSTGDLNNDNLPDLLVSSNGTDRVNYNLGNNANGSVDWSSNITVDIIGGSDDGFGGNNLVVDLDGDGWNDALICDVDVDLSGCNRRLHIYRNPGGTPGDLITLQEEAEQAGNGGWKGVVGLTVNDMRGMHDVAVFDIDGDGDQDMVLGRCVGTFVYLQEADSLGTTYCSPATPNSTGQPGVLVATGSDVAGGNPLTLTASQLPANQFGYLVASRTQALIMNPGGSEGDLCLGSPIARFNSQVGNSGAGGEIAIDVDTLSIPLSPPVPVLAGETWNFQMWHRDANPTPTSNFTDAVSILFQ